MRTRCSASSHGAGVRLPHRIHAIGIDIIITWIAHNRDTSKTLDLMVQAAFKVMSNDVLGATNLAAPERPSGYRAVLRKCASC